MGKSLPTGEEGDAPRTLTTVTNAFRASDKSRKPSTGGARPSSSRRGGPPDDEPPDDDDGDDDHDPDGDEPMEDRGSVLRRVREAIEMLSSENVGVVDFDDTLDTDAGSYRTEIEAYQGVKNAIQHNQNESVFAVNSNSATGGHMASRTVLNPPLLKPKETTGQRHNFAPLRLQDNGRDGGERFSQWIFSRQDEFKKSNVKATEILKRMVPCRTAFHGNEAKTECSNDLSIHPYVYAIRNALGHDKGERTAWRSTGTRFNIFSLLGPNKPEKPDEQPLSSKMVAFGVASRHCAGQTDWSSMKGLGYSNPGTDNEGRVRTDNACART